MVSEIPPSQGWHYDLKSECVCIEGGWWLHALSKSESGCSASRLPASWVHCRGQSSQWGVFTKQYSGETADQSPQVLPSPFAARSVTDGLAETRCSGHMNHARDLQYTKGSLLPPGSRIQLVTGHLCPWSWARGRPGLSELCGWFPTQLLSINNTRLFQAGLQTTWCLITKSCLTLWPPWTVAC